jgi:PAS domain S-box-containing protein
MKSALRAFRDLPLRHKLISIIVATSCLSLVLASIAFVAYDRSTFKAKMVRDVSVEADIIATNSTAALTFNDIEAAKVTLSALSKEPSIVAARLESANGGVVAEYRRGGVGRHAAIPLLGHVGHVFTEERLAVRREISFDGERLGYVYIEADLKALAERLNRFLLMVVTIVAVAMLIVIFASSQLQRLISEPILRLAYIANRISREKDYTVRAAKQGRDEVGTLIDGFNEMLSQIEQRDAMLERHKDELEGEVAERTAELREVNRELHANQTRLRAIVEGTASTTGEEFFDALARALSKALGMRWVLVGRLRPNHSIDAMAMWDGEKIVHDTHYDLAGTPCEVALERESLMVEDGVTEAYPADELLAEWGARSYIGYALRDRLGRKIGVLNAVHDDPLPETAKDRSLLRVFASRAAAELERLEVGAELRRSETSTRAILESAADGIITVGSDGKVETLNPAAETMFRRRPEHVVGRSVALLMRFPGDSHAGEDVERHPEELVKGFIDTRGEIEGIRADGSTFPMNIAAGRMEIDGQTSYTAIVRDVTREHELDRMKADFISTVSHEIRTPLACIMSSAKILQRNGDARPQVTPKFSGIIIEEGKRLTRLINDLLDLSKMDSNSVEWSFGDEAVNGLFEPIIAAFSAQAAERKIRLDYSIAEDTPTVYVDKDKAIQVLTNLVSNAIKFSDGGGTVSLRAERCSELQGFVKFSVSDSGIGIAPEHHETIFERFKQIGDVQTDRPQGTGLGLPICREIVQYFGGKIWVESSAGRGSTFSFTVPVATAHMTPHERESQEAPVLEGHADGPDGPVVAQAALHAAADENRARTACGADGAEVGEAGDGEHDHAAASERVPLVLVVDDDEPTRKIIAFHLQSNGFEVVQASCGEEALETARRCKPALITLDVMMPDISGYDVLQALRADRELGQTPVVLLSVLAGERHGSHALRVGANAYLSKPISASRLLGSVNRLLGGKSKDVLVIDDDLGESAAIKTNLAAQGYAVVQAFNGQTGIDFARRLQPDLIILGSPASSVDGQAILESLRGDHRTQSIPVVLLTATDVESMNTVSLGTEISTAPNDQVRSALTQLLRNLSWIEPEDESDDDTESKTLH